LRIKRHNLAGGGGSRNLKKTWGGKPQESFDHRPGVLPLNRKTKEERTKKAEGDTKTLKETLQKKKDKKKSPQIQEKK